jgi:hypothetical protein
MDRLDEEMMHEREHTEFIEVQFQIDFILDGFRWIVERNSKVFLVDVGELRYGIPTNGYTVTVIDVECFADGALCCGLTKVASNFVFDYQVFANVTR